MLKHKVISSGGGRSVLVAAAVRLVLEHFGIRAGLIGGVSGGAIIGAIWSASVAEEDGFPNQLSAKAMLEQAFEIDFSSLVSCSATSWQQFLALTGKARAEAARPRPRTGVYGTEPLGSFIDSRVPRWPRLWILAVAEETPIVLNGDGIFEWVPKLEKFKQLPLPPVSVGTAVRFTCTIPGMFIPLTLEGDELERHVYDGAYSIFGQCPVAVALKHFGVRANDLIACDASKGPTDRGILGAIKWGWEALWRVPPDPKWPAEAADVIRIAPRSSVKALDLALSADKKWLGGVQAVVATLQTLRNSDLLHGNQKRQAASLLRTLHPVSVLRASRRHQGRLASLAQSVLGDHGLL